MPIIDPQMAKALEYMRARTKLREGVIPSGMLEVRKNVTKDFSYWNEDPPALYSVTDLKIKGAYGDRSVRHYVPVGRSNAAPALIHFHGGGWIVGDLELEDRFLREFALESGFDIFSVDYVLAPEHKHPEPLNDCLAISSSICENAETLNIDRERLGVSGSSAGANLALATALSLKNSKQQIFQNIILFYGVFDASIDSDSHREFADGTYSPGGPGMEMFLERYLQDQKDRVDPLVSPILADLSGLPPCYLCVAELDSLRDDSFHLETKLKEVDVPVTLNFYAGVIHGFTTMSRDVDIAKTAICDAALYLKSTL